MMKRFFRAGVVAAAFSTAQAFAQNNPVYVDDSPLAWETFREAQAQTDANLGEAVRLYQELLDEFALRLIPADGADPDRFMAVRGRVLDALASNPALLERHRIVEQAEARRLHDAGEYEWLALTRPFTTPGLDALLRQAQWNIESGRFETASHLLKLAIVHPDIAAQNDAAAYAWYMDAVAAYYLDEHERLQHASRSLERLGHRGAVLLNALEELAAGAELPPGRVGVSPLDTGTAGHLDELVAEEIWTVRLDESLYSRRFNEGRQIRRQARRTLEQMAEDGFLLAVAPTVAGDVVYINEGHQISALDRFTGSPRWPQVFVERPPLTIIDREDDYARDLNVIAVEHDSLVTLSGHAHATSRSNDAAVLCLNADSGELRWSTWVDRISGLEEHEGLFPHSAPIIAEGKVFVLARKVSAQSLTSSYLVALDLQSGELEWIRHIASSGSIRRAARPFSTLVYEEGDLYVKTAVGAVARIEAANGQVRWLHRTPVSLNPGSAEQTRRPWELDKPIVTPRNVLSLVPGLQRVLVLDRETGHEVARYDAGSREGWNNPSYLIAHGAWVYAIGREIRAFHFDMLDAPHWTLSDAGDRAFGELQLRGRVQVAQTNTGLNTLIVPTSEGLLIVDGQTGVVTNRMSGISGNPVAVDSQLFVAGNQRLESYMSMSQAVSMLNDRIQAAPDDPQPALALLRLSIRVDNLDLVLASARAAMHAMQAASTAVADGARGALFDLLLGIEPSRLIRTHDEGEAVFELVQEIATEPERQLAYRLAYGDWLAGHDHDRAVSTYQSVLSDEALARLPRIENKILRQAAAWTTQRIAAILDEHGEHLYLQQTVEADRRLNQLLGSGETDLGALVQLASEFPLAPAAVTAAIEAARLQLQQDAKRTALAPLTRLYRQLPGDVPFAREPAYELMRAFAQVCEEHGWASHAQAAAQSVSPETDNLFGTDGRPRVGLQRGHAALLRGALMPMREAAARSTLPLDRVFLFDQGSVRFLDGEELQERWSVEVAGDSPEILFVDDQRVLLWFPHEHSDPRAAMISAADGQHFWTTPRLDEHLQPVAQIRRGRNVVPEQMPSGEVFDANETLPLCNGSSLIMVRRSGGVIAFDLNDGTKPRWVVDGVLQQVHVAQLHDGMVVLAGMHRQGTSDMVPGIVVLDEATGKSLHGDRPLTPVGNGGVTWMTVTPMGMLLCASESGVEAWDMFSGTMQWMNLTDLAGAAQQAWTSSEHVLLKTGSAELSRVDTGRASISPAYALPSGGGAEELLDVHIEGDHAVACFDQRVVRYDGSGAIIGADIIRDTRRYRWMLRADDRIIVVSARSTRQEQISGQAGRRTQHVYRVYSLSENGRLLDDALELPPLHDPLREARLINGWLLVSGQHQTLAVPFPKDE